MGNLFLTILNISITASYIALASIMLRFLLKKNPKWISCLLWALLAVRLLVPFSLESKLSLIPDSEPIKANTSVSSVSPSVNNNTSQTPAVNNNVSDIPITPVTPVNPDKSEDTPVQDIAPITPDADNLTLEEKETDIFSVLSYIWIGGAGCMIAYSALSYLRIKARVRASIKTDKNIYICDDISTPFILGVIKPRIYLPSTLSGDELQYITNHEKAHLRRCDHLWKPLGFILLSFHWFNPLMWVSYILLCRDIELACDEKVLKDMGADSKKHYSETLLSFSTERKLVSACPLAFGEVGVKQRIKNILNYKKPAFWITALSIILCIAVGFCFLTNPVTDTKDDSTAPSVELPVEDTTDGYLLYSYEDESHSLKKSHIKLFPEDNSFEFMIHPLSSYLPMGTYRMEGNKLILECTDDDNKYVFLLFNSWDLMFVENESSKLPEFRYSAEENITTPPFGDGAIFTFENQDKYTAGVKDEIVPYSSYETIIKNIIDTFNRMQEDTSGLNPSFSYASYMYRRHDDLSDIGYTLIDLDKNGVDELVISGIDSSFVYDMYTKIDDAIIHLFSSGERYYHNLFEDGYVHLGWSGGAGVSGHDFMKFSNGKIEFIERITLDAYYAEESGVIEKLEDAGSDNCFFKSTSQEEKDYIHITDEEALNLIKSHKNKKKELDLDFIPLTSYCRGDIDDESADEGYVMFDIDSDGVEELCSVLLAPFSHKPECTLYLSAETIEQRYYQAQKELYAIPDITIDTTRSTATNFYLKRSDTNLYLFIEESVGSREIYMLELKNNMIFITESHIAPFYLSDIAYFDINSDGEEEALSLQKLWWSTGEFSFTISFTASDGVVYNNSFVLPDDLALRFEEEDGKLYVVTTLIDLERRYEVIVEKGLIVLSCEGDTIPYYDNDYLLDNQDFFYVTDQMRFDIDGDGKKEDVTIRPAITSGVFAFAIVAQNDSKNKLTGFFTGYALDFSFEKDKDGTVYLKGIKDDYIKGVIIEDTETHKYKIQVENYRITLTENGTPYSLTQTNPLPDYYSKVIDNLKKYEEGYKTHDVEILNSCFDHTFIDPRDKEVIDDLVNTVTDCKIESVKFIEESDDTVKFHVTYEITYNEDYLGVGNRLPGYNLVSADFIFTKVRDEYLISSMDLEGASHIR